MPKIPVRREGTSFDGADITPDRANYVESDKPLMDATDILTMPKDKLLCLLRGYNPLLATRVRTH